MVALIELPYNLNLCILQTNFPKLVIYEYFVLDLIIANFTVLKDPPWIKAYASETKNIKSNNKTYIEMCWFYDI